MALSLLMPGRMHAQIVTPQIEQALRQTQSDIARQRLPAQLPEQKDLNLWVQPANKSSPTPFAEPKPVDLAKVRVLGSSYLTAEQINAAFEPLQGKKVDLQDLRRVAEQLEAQYREAGFFLTRVFVPLQQSQEGVFEIRVVEGFVSAVVVEGGTEAMRLQIEAAMQNILIGKKPVTITALQNAQSVVKEFKDYAATVKLRQGKALGASEVVVSFKPLVGGTSEPPPLSDQLPSLNSPVLLATPQPTPPRAEPARAVESDVARLRVPQPLPEPKDFEIFIQQTEKTPVNKAVDDLVFDLSGVRVEGSSYYSAPQIDAMFAHLVGKKVSISDLRAVAEQLETQYRDAGFFLTRVFLPPQQVKNGVFEIRVIEGYISAGFAEGGNDITRARIEGLLQNNLVGKKPLNLAALERTLLVANEFPGYTASSMLRQGSEVGTSELVATLVDVPGSQNLSINNNSSNVTGPWGYGYSGVFNNKLGRGEQISVGVNAGADFSVLKSLSLKYAEPLGSSGLVGSIGALMSEAHPAGSVAALKIVSVGSSITPRLRYPLLRGRDSSVYVESGLSVNKTETTIDGAALTLDQFTVWDANVAWLYKTQNAGAGNARMSIARGVPYFGVMQANASNPSVVGFDNHFLKWTYGLQHTYALTPQASVQLSVNGQSVSSSTKLLSGEQVSFGGAALGRGYDGGTISGDSGYGGLLELRYDLAYRHAALLAPVQLYAFTDAAEATTNANAVTGTDASFKALASHGFGARFVFVRSITLDVQFANMVHLYESADTRPNPRITINSSVSF